MTDFVKGFIEANIEFIDAEDWAEVVSLWYGEVASNFTYDDNEFIEFGQVLSSAGINFMDNSISARTEFMKNLMSQYLEENVDSARYSGKSEIKKNDILMCIDSDLGFTYEELEKILDDVSENEYKLELDFTCYYVR